ncbi:hypothetical protein J6590_027564 [Homalodisca vitripennis]|nr:hypothetical protein J6590_027564 [Homalodisca vitripennis]
MLALSSFVYTSRESSQNDIYSTLAVRAVGQRTRKARGSGEYTAIIQGRCPLNVSVCRLACSASTLFVAELSLSTLYHSEINRRSSSHHSISERATESINLRSLFLRATASTEPVVKCDTEIRAINERGGRAPDGSKRSPQPR